MTRSTRVTAAMFAPQRRSVQRCFAEAFLVFGSCRLVVCSLLSASIRPRLSALMSPKVLRASSRNAFVWVGAEGFSES